MESVPHVPVSSVAGDETLELGDCTRRLEHSHTAELAIYRLMYRFTDPLPGVLQSEHGGVSEGRAHLEDSVEVVETPADVGNCRPLL